MSDDIQAAIKWCRARAEAAFLAIQVLEQYTAQVGPAAVEAPQLAPPRIAPAPARAKRSKGTVKSSAAVRPVRPVSKRAQPHGGLDQAILSTLAASKEPLKAAAIAKAHSISVETAWTILQRLVGLKQVVRDGRTYSVKLATRSAAPKPETPALETVWNDRKTDKPLTGNYAQKGTL